MLINVRLFLAHCTHCVFTFALILYVRNLGFIFGLTMLSYLFYKLIKCGSVCCQSSELVLSSPFFCISCKTGKVIHSRYCRCDVCSFLHLFAVLLVISMRIKQNSHTIKNPEAGKKENATMLRATSGQYIAHPIQHLNDYCNLSLTNGSLNCIVKYNAGRLFRFLYLSDNAQRLAPFI